MMWGKSINRGQVVFVYQSLSYS